MSGFNFQSFVLGFACATLFIRLLFAFGSKPIWYQRWRTRRHDKRFWASCDEESKSWYRKYMPNEARRYESL